MNHGLASDAWSNAAYREAVALARRDRLREAILKAEIDALLVTDEINVGYLSGFSGDSSYVLVSAVKGGDLILSDRRYETQLAEECSQLPALVRGPDRKMTDLIEQAVSASRVSRLGFEAVAVNWDLHRQWVDRLKSIEWFPAPDWVSALRMIKDDHEIRCLRRAVWIAERTFESIRARLRPDWTERQVAQEIEVTIRDLGGDGCGFPPIVAFGASGALPHYRPGRFALGESATILLDWGAKLNGYTSDLTRTLHLLNDPPRGFEAAYEAVLAAHAKAVETIRDGALAKDVDAAARQVLIDASLGDQFKHGLGHGIGLRVHEAPRLGATSDETLAAGMVVTVEPGAYLEGQFGIRIEDDVLVTANGCELLSSLPRDYASMSFAL